MRSFLILLLFANLAYLTWWQGWLFDQPEPLSDLERPVFQQAGQGLLLLNELPQERLDLMRSLAEARTARAGAEQELQQAQQEVVLVEGKIGEVQAEVVENRAQSEESQQALADTLDAVIEEEVSSLEPPAPATPWCAHAGVFANREAAEAFARSLEMLGIEALIESREAPVSSTWWVYMPAFASEATAMGVLAELQAKNIDSYYMRSGDMAGGISLGVFSYEESALIAQRQRAEQGYASSIREVVRTGERLYVALAMSDGALRETPEWAAFLASAEGVGVTENACETIASENEFP
jgi:cell division septation protein DedD